MAFPLIAGPFFLLAYGPVEAVALTALCSVTGQLLSIALLRRAIAYDFRPYLILPGLCAVPLGAIILTHSNSTLVRGGLGTLIVISGIWGLLQAAPHSSRRVSVLSEVLVGLTGGLSGGLVGASAVAPAIWCTWQGLDKEYQRAVTQPFILAMQAFSFISLAFLGQLVPSIAVDYAQLLIPLSGGIAVGVTCFRVVSSATATRVVLLLVTLSGLALLLA